MNKNDLSIVEKYIDWKDISKNPNISDEFLEQYEDKVDWREIFANKPLSESMIMKYGDKVGLKHWIDWQSEINTFSESFIRDIFYKVKARMKVENDFHIFIPIFEHQQLSESFLREIMNQVKKWWHLYVAQFQTFSLSFAIEMEMWSCIDEIGLNQKIPKEEKDKIIETLKLVGKLTS